MRDVLNSLMRQKSLLISTVKKGRCYTEMKFHNSIKAKPAETGNCNEVDNVIMTLYPLQMRMVETTAGKSRLSSPRLCSGTTFNRQLHSEALASIALSVHNFMKYLNFIY